MFYFTGCILYVIHRVTVKTAGFPHSDIFGSKVARHLPEAYRRHATSFITSLESRHPPYALKFPIRKFKNHIRHPSTQTSEFFFCRPSSDRRAACSVLLYEINSHIAILFVPLTLQSSEQDCFRPPPHLKRPLMPYWYMTFRNLMRGGI
jgi:hypothetical protein